MYIVDDMLIEGDLDDNANCNSINQEFYTDYYDVSDHGSVASSEYTFNGHGSWSGLKGGDVVRGSDRKYTYDTNTYDIFKGNEQRKERERG